MRIRAIDAEAALLTWGLFSERLSASSENHDFIAYYSSFGKCDLPSALWNHFLQDYPLEEDLRLRILV